jgi:oligoribonuclease
MHASSGLTDEVLASTVTLQEAEQRVLDYIKQYVPEPKKAPLCGNSIATDRGFITRDMPLLDEWLHYRMVDVSSVKELARRWYPRAYFNAPKKGGGHRALADIEESVQELQYYRAAVFVPQPGPTSEQAAQLSAQIGGGDADGASRLPAPSEVVPD